MAWAPLDRMLQRAGRRAVADEIASLQAQISGLESQLDAARSRLDVNDGLLAEYEHARDSVDYQDAFTSSQPLVSVCVATYNRAGLLTQRCLPSLLGQTYRNIEIIVVGDACTDDTPERVVDLKDPRIRFENLKTRGPYPADADRRWMVAGTYALNRALSLARGSFVTHLDDDDEHAAHRIEALVETAQRTRADLVFHPFRFEAPDGTWQMNPATAFRKGRATTSSVLTHGWFSRIPWDPHAHRYLEPGDWNRFRKIEFLGASITRHPEALLRHYSERRNSA